MRLYLIRHGQATDESVNPDRPLTDGGRRDVAALASQLQAAGLVPYQFLHSGKTRASQTAEILNGRLRAPAGVDRGKGLKPNDPPDAIVARIATWQEDTALVGHLPSLAIIARALMGPGLPVTEFPVAGAVVLERDAAGHWRLLAQFAP